MEIQLISSEIWEKSMLYDLLPIPVMWYTLDVQTIFINAACQDQLIITAWERRNGQGHFQRELDDEAAMEENQISLGVYKGYDFLHRRISAAAGHASSDHLEHRLAQSQYWGASCVMQTGA